MLSYEAIFRERADRYQQAMEDCPHARDAEFGVIVEPLAGLSRIIDMPAGGGYLRHHLPGDVRYVAVEPSPLFFGRCPSDDHADRIQSPVENVPLPNGYASGIACLAGLHHAPDIVAIFAEMRRLLSVDGIAALADVAEGSAPDAFLNDYVHRNSNMGHEGVFLSRETRTQLEQSGFRIVDDAITPTPWIFADRVEAGAFCSNLFGIDGRTPAEVADALAHIIGIEETASECRVDWSLRRIVATAI